MKAFLLMIPWLFASVATRAAPPVSLQPRIVTIGLAATAPYQASPHGHAWVILAVKEGGETKTTGYGWYPLKDSSEETVPGTIRMGVGGITGVGGVPGTLKDTDLYRDGAIYLQKVITEGQYEAVMTVINGRLNQPPSSTYDGIVNNCVDLSDKVAKAAGFNTPAVIGGTFTRPASYGKYMIEHNAAEVTPKEWQRMMKDQKGKTIPLDDFLTEKWNSIINDATRIDRGIRDERWRFYQPQRTAEIKRQASQIEDRRATEHDNSSRQNGALAGQAAQAAAYHAQRVKQDNARMRGYGGGGSISYGAGGSVSSGGNGFGGGGSSTPPQQFCTTPICLFTGRNESGASASQIAAFSTLQTLPVVAAAAADKPTAPTPPPQYKSLEDAINATYPPGIYLNIEVGDKVGYWLPQSSGNNALLDLGWMPVGGALSVTLTIENHNQPTIALEADTVGSKLSRIWSAYSSVVAGPRVVRLGNNERTTIEIKFDASRPYIQDMQTLVLKQDGHQLIDITIDYFLVPDATVQITDEMRGFVSGLGKKFGNEYLLTSGPAPLHYTLSKVLLDVSGQRGHHCGEPDRSRDAYADCKVYQTDDADVRRGVRVQGLDGGGGFGGPDDTVISSAKLTAAYRLINDVPQFKLINP